MELSYIYNPANLSANEIIESFVIRTKQFSDLLAEIKRDRMKHPPQHFIIQGQRGSGKTTLLLRLYYEIQRDDGLKEWMIPVIFSEEQYNVRTLFKLWEELAVHLEKESDQFAGLCGAMEQIEYKSDKQYEEDLYQLVSGQIKKSKKKVTLLVDNIGLLFVKFPKREQQKLREILITDNNIRIIGASASVLESINDYLEPFYEFFKVVELESLTCKESQALLLKLDRKYKKGDVKKIIENQPERIEAIRRISGGVPRTIILLFEIFSDEESGNSIKDLEIVLDKVTPLYKHRMDDLSPQQQEIAHIIAVNWDAVSVAEIARKAKMESKKVSSQLNLMVVNGLINKIPTNTKNNLYQIRERFFNIWYLMRLGSVNEREKVKWLVKFLEVWCSREQLTERAGKHIQRLGAQTCRMHEKYAFYFSEALAEAGLDTDMQHDLIGKTRGYLQKMKSPLFDEVELSHEKIKDSKFDEPDGADLYLGKRNNLPSKGYNCADDYKSEFEKGLPDAMNNLAWLYFEKKDNKAIALIMAQNAYAKSREYPYCFTYCMMLLWNNEINEANKTSKFFLDKNEFYDNIADMVLYLEMVLAKKQFHFLDKLFKENKFDIKSRFKAHYYTLMHFMKKDYPNEYLKMGGELKQTVEEIIGKVNQMEKDYA